MAIRDRDEPFANRGVGSAATLERPSLELHAGAAPPAIGDSSSTDAGAGGRQQPAAFGFEMDHVNRLVTFTATGPLDISPTSVTIPFAGVEMAFHQMLTAKLAPVYQTALASVGAPLPGLPAGFPAGRPF